MTHHVEIVRICVVLSRECTYISEKKHEKMMSADVTGREGTMHQFEQSIGARKFPKTQPPSFTIFTLLGPVLGGEVLVFNDSKKI